jgi:hypothetical protein
LEASRIPREDRRCLAAALDATFEAHLGEATSTATNSEDNFPMIDERDQKLLEALHNLHQASLEIATEIHALRGMLVSVIAPALRDTEGLKTREGYLRTAESGKP